MNTQAQRSMPATTEQIATALRVLFSSMPLPRGVNPENASFGYIQALQGFSIEAITHGIRRFLRGECEDVNMRFCPHPPELAAIVRKTVHSRPDSKKKYFMYRQPKSKQLERGVTKDYAWQLIANGVHPKGSIWCPGDVYDRPEIGDLFAPDPEWKHAIPCDWRPPHSDAVDKPENKIRMGFKMALLSKALNLRQVEKLREANEQGMEDLMGLAQTWGVPIPDSLWAKP